MSAGVSAAADGSTRRRRIGGVVVGIAFLLAASSGWARGQVAQPAIPPGVQGPLARYVPQQDLISYLEFDGVDAHQAAWRASAAYKLLTSTKLGVLLEDLVGQYTEVSQQFTPAESRVKSADIIGTFELAARQGFAFGAWEKGPEQVGTVFVVRGGDRPELHRLLELATRSDPAPEPVQKSGARSTRSIRRASGGSRKVTWSCPTSPT